MNLAFPIGSAEFGQQKRNFAFEVLEGNAVALVTLCCTALCRNEVFMHSVHFVTFLGCSQFGSRRGLVPNSHDRLTPRSPIFQCRKSIGEAL